MSVNPRVFRFLYVCCRKAYLNKPNDATLLLSFSLWMYVDAVRTIEILLLSLLNITAIAISQLVIVSWSSNAKLMLFYIHFSYYTCVLCLFTAATTSCFTKNKFSIIVTYITGANRLICLRVTFGFRRHHLEEFWKSRLRPGQLPL